MNPAGCCRLVFLAAATIAAAVAPLQAEMIVDLKNGANDSVTLFSDPRGSALKQQTQILRERMLNWKERDFLALFGKPAGRVDAMAASVFPGGEFARLSTEPSGVGLPGLRNPANNKDHTDLYDIGQVGRIEVFFGQNGDPVYLAFYLKMDSAFVTLRNFDSAEPRLAWEKPRIEALAREIDSRWRQTVVWEVDRAMQAKQLSGLNSTNPQEIWNAFTQWINPMDYQVIVDSSIPGRTSYQWYDQKIDGNKVVAESQQWGVLNVPQQISLRYSRPDGIKIDLGFGLHTTGHISWRRQDETMIRADFRSWTNHPQGDVSSLPPDAWAWSDSRGQPIRREIDTNGDGLPDQFWEPGMAADSYEHLVIEKSWVVNQELIPEQSRVPDQEVHRLPVRRILP